MSNRRKRGTSAVGGSLDGMDQNELTSPGTDLQNTSTTDFANAGYGSRVATGTEEFRVVDAGRITARPLEIGKIHPDAAQPRRAIPSSLRQYWNGSPDHRSMANLFDHWKREVELERGEKAFDIVGYVGGDITERVPNEEIAEDDLPQLGREHEPRAKEVALMRIIELATSVLRDGLLNPISVAPYGGRYVIETGERRWLAYQLLNWLFPGDDTWARIPARQVDSVNIWRQAGENNARSDLNAIARARQLALLIMAIYEVKGESFQPFEAFEQEQQFYAQVSDGTIHRIPAHMMEQVLNATGLSSSTQVRQHRQLLRLPNPIWVVADDLNWAQNKIERDILQNAQSNDEKLSRAYLEAHKEGYSVSTLTLPPGETLTPAEDGKMAHAATESKFTRYRKMLLTLRKSLDEFPTQQREALLDHVETILKMYR